MLTGNPPFHGDNPMAVMSQHINGIIPRVDKIKPGVVSPQIAAIVARAVQRDPEKRYQTVNDMITDLDHLDKVDTSILDVVQTAPSTHPVHVFWRSPAVRTTLIMVGIVALIVILAVALHSH
jgi:serine/threonine protein kinase